MKMKVCLLSMLLLYVNSYAASTNNEYSEIPAQFKKQKDFYVIQDTVSLGEEYVSLPSGASLFIDGGFIREGSIRMNGGSIIISEKSEQSKIFDGVVFSGEMLSELTPFMFGFKTGLSGEESYKAIYNVHKAAVSTSTSVSYKGINTVHLTIPAGFKSIPLSDINDFEGVTFVVSNDTKDIYLFELRQTLHAIEVDKECLDTYDFSENDMLMEGKKALVVTDQIPWVEKREGFSYGATRQDILYFENGSCQNRTILDYNSFPSSPEFGFFKVPDRIEVKNINIQRVRNARYKTNCFHFINQGNIYLNNINIKTPESDLTADRAIHFENCVNVTIENTNVDGTYSKTKEHGYAFKLNNVWNSRFIKLVAHGDWGVFGTDNMNTVFLESCDINRFDIHYYGRDITCIDCTFSDFYNQFSSVYGEISFRECTFTDCSPVRTGNSWNAYTAYQLYFKGCKFNISKEKNHIIRIGSLNRKVNSRPELKAKCWPNVFIENCIINSPIGVKKIYLFDVVVAKTGGMDVDYIDRISINGLQVNSVEKDVELFVVNHKVKTKKEVLFSLHNINVPVSTELLTSLKKKQ